jgi:hypothetical protein
MRPHTSRAHSAKSLKIESRNFQDVFRVTRDFACPPEYA